MSDEIRDILYAHQRRGTLTAACICGAMSDDGVQPSGIATQRHWEHVSRVIAVAVDQKWTDWLASVGYGIDYSSRADPPTTLSLLADAYVRITGEEDRETWAWCITENTGAMTNPTHA